MYGVGNVGDRAVVPAGGAESVMLIRCNHPVTAFVFPIGAKPIGLIGGAERYPIGNTDQLIFFAFDLLSVGDMDLGHEDLRELPLAERKARLKAVLASQKKTDPIIRYVEHFETAGDAVLRSACRMALEGIVSKRLDLHYVSGRGAACTKAKCRAGHEVVIGGWSETHGRGR